MLSGVLRQFVLFIVSPHWSDGGELPGVLAGPGHPLRPQRPGDPQQGEAVSLGPVTHRGRDAEQTGVKVDKFVRGGGGGLAGEHQSPSRLEVV